MKKLAIYSLLMISYGVVTCAIRAEMYGTIRTEIVPIIILSPVIWFFVKYLSQ